MIDNGIVTTVADPKTMNAQAYSDFSREELINEILIWRSMVQETIERNE